MILSGALTIGFILLYQTLGSLLFAPWIFCSTFNGWGANALYIFGIVINIIQGITSKFRPKFYLYGPLNALAIFNLYGKALKKNKY